jgi:glycosyltransferase involved in cell wall biosynthesis
MANKISIVVVCKNEVNAIDRLLQSVRLVTDDIVVYDNGSTDGTVEKLMEAGVHLHQGPWLGFGKTKREAVALATHEWILSLDADESLDEQLQQELIQLDLQNDKEVFDVPFKNFLGKKHLKWGEWGGDHHIRLFNRRQVNWNNAVVHEELIFPKDIRVIKLKGSILHHTMKDMADYSHKMVQYALLNAEKYFAKGKRSGFLKTRVSPALGFFMHYIIQLGFLDGWEGYTAARMTAFYTFLKYTRLRELWENKEGSALENGARNKKEL